MFRLKSLLAAALAWLLVLPAVPAEAYSGHQRLIFNAAGLVPPAGAVTGDPILLSVNATGWTLNAIFYNIPAKHNTNAYALVPDGGAPALSCTVTSPGFDASGSPTTVTRTVIGTIWLRQPWSSNLLPTEATTNLGVQATIVLSDFVFYADTLTCTFLSGVYTNGAASNAKSNVAVVNHSTLQYPKPTGSYLTENHLAIEAGASFTVEAFFSHPYARSNRELAAMKFTISDGVHSVTSSAVSTMTKSARLYSTTGDVALGSNTIANIADTSHFQVGHQVTLKQFGGQPKVASIVTNTSITLTPTTIVLTSSSTTSGSPNVTVSNTSGLFQGMPLSDTQFAGGTTVLSVTDATHFVASATAAGTSSTESITFTQTANATATGQPVTIGNPVYVFSSTFSSGSMSGLSNGAVTVDCTAYPFIGNQTFSCSQGSDGVPIAATTLTSNLKPLAEIYDAAANHAPIYTWARSGGTCTGLTCVSTSATDPGTGNAANYASIGAAIAGCKLYNNANRGHNDTSGCVVYARAVGSPWSGFGSSITAQTSGLGWVTIAAAPGDAVTFQTGSQKVIPAGYFKFVGLTITPSDNTSGNSIVIQGVDGSNTNPLLNELLFENDNLTCKLTSTAMVFQVGLRSYYNNTIDETVGECNLLQAFGVGQVVNGVVGGNSVVGLAGTSRAWLTNFAGNVMHGMTIVDSPQTSANFLQPTAMVNYANKYLSNPAPFQSQANTAISQNYADVLNVYEKITNDSQPAVGWLNDGMVNPFLNFFQQLTSTAGERRNDMYGDTGSAPIFKFGWASWNVDAYGRYVKRDTFNNPSFHQQPGRIGNLAWSHGVGHFGDAFAPDAVDSNNAPSSTAWIGEYIGQTGSTTPNNTGYNLTLRFAHNGGVLGNLADGTGDGYYLPAAGSPACGRIPAGFAPLPADIQGVAYANDNTDCAGAYARPSAY